MQATGLYRRKSRKISLTALIDVVFILLMFFMLTSTFSQWKAVDFKSPVASEAPLENEPEVLVLAVDGSLRKPGGSLEIGPDQPVAASTFAADATLVLVPEEDVRVQMIISRLEEIEKLGLSVTMGGVTETDTSRVQESP